MINIGLNDMGAKGFDSRITPLNGSRAISTGAKSYTRVRFPTPPPLLYRKCRNINVVEYIASAI